jgi:hypothetical protein
MSDDERDAKTPESGLVCIFRTGDDRLVAIARSLLDGEAIPYLARGADLQELFGIRRLAGGFTVVGSIDFMVRPEDAERASTVLGALREGFIKGATEIEKNRP